MYEITTTSQTDINLYVLNTKYMKYKGDVITFSTNFSIIIFDTKFVNTICNTRTKLENSIIKILSAGYALGIWICGCSLFYKREFWASKSAGAHSTKSLKISGCKR